MFAFIKRRLREYKRRKAILRDIKMAKDVYINNGERFMCWCFRHIDKDKYPSIDEIQKHIPEFNPTYMNAEKWATKDTMWWLVADRESRIKAFDKLIGIYGKLWL